MLIIKLFETPSHLLGSLFRLFRQVVLFIKLFEPIAGGSRHIPRRSSDLTGFAGSRGGHSGSTCGYQAKHGTDQDETGQAPGDGGATDLSKLLGVFFLLSLLFHGLWYFCWGDLLVIAFTIEHDGCWLLVVEKNERRRDGLGLDVSQGDQVVEVLPGLSQGDCPTVSTFHVILI